ncbi:aminopeptidase P family protein [Permianibacter sp. IMCC34836]|uniref:M24 family metallopeptidase n=1 Tax=Permianibacter fluminis TaxID=2738515 RepID=UPI001554C405|nr:Xaa-Pro peptidase family protein [Permianibacter fluminis]NQD37157.1 aminopeptidase P family protein [Permianibacter fluminis]
MNRRHFLRTAAATSTLAALLPVPALATAAGNSKTYFDPERVAAIRRRIAPISSQEFRARQEQARRLMTEHKLDALLVEAGTSLQYFTGLSWWPSERLFAMVLPRTGEPFFISPKFEEGRAREKLGDVRVLTWEEHEDPYAQLKQGFKDAGLLTATLGIDETTRFFIIDKLQQALPQLKLQNGIAVTAGCRSVKSASEIALMQVANDITADVYKKAQSLLREGMGERELAELISQLYGEFGVTGDALVLFGQASAYPHGLVKESFLKAGDIVLLDGGCEVEGYGSDITRTMVLGTASDKMKTVWDIVRRAQDLALKTARPGLPAEQVDAAARQFIAEQGYGPGYQHFTHRLGHGIGMDGHEWFYLVGGNKRPLQVGNMFSNEPGIYLIGEFGIRLEDEMLITEDGARLLLPQAKSLDVIF